MGPLEMEGSVNGDSDSRVDQSPSLHFGRFLSIQRHECLRVEAMASESP
jgi:hypothetical protein